MHVEDDKPRTLDSFLRRADDSQATTTAKRIRVMANPYLSSVARCVRRNVVDSEDHLHDKRIFHFEDGSFLMFDVTYAVAKDGE